MLIKKVSELFAGNKPCCNGKQVPPVESGMDTFVTHNKVKKTTLPTKPTLSMEQREVGR